MINAFIGLGANIGNPETQLQSAAHSLATLPSSQLCGHSKIYTSRPMGPQDQPDFLNSCVHLNTALSPLTLLAELQQIERVLGRVKTRHWGERFIDLDLLMYGNKQMDTNELTLPHPGIHNRDFVLKPLQDLLGEHFRMPDGETIGKLLTARSSLALVETGLSLFPAYTSPPTQL